MTVFFKKGILVALFIIIYIVLTSLWGFYWGVRPPHRLNSSIKPNFLGMEYEDVVFNTIDNIPIRGWFIPTDHPNAKTIILLHGYPADKGNLLPHFYFLHDRYHLLFIDFRYFGESGGTYSTLGEREVWDLLAAIEYLKQRNINNVGVYGFSMGGAVALMTAVLTPEIKAVIADSSYANLNLMLQSYYNIPILRYPLALLTRFWGRLFLGYDAADIDPSAASQLLKIPVMIIHSANDTVVPIEHAEILRNSLKNNKKAQFLFLEHKGHGTITEESKKATLKFFDTYL